MHKSVKHRPLKSKTLNLNGEHPHNHAQLFLGLSQRTAGSGGFYPPGIKQAADLALLLVR